MLNLLRNTMRFIRIMAARQRTYSWPAYLLGMCVAVDNAGPGPVAWLRGGRRPLLQSSSRKQIRLGHAGLYPGVKICAHGEGKITVGNGTFINHDSQIKARTSVCIGDNSMVSWDVLITDFMDFEKAPEQSVRFRHKPVRIGHECWIGAKALILGGTVLGDGCLVAAGAVVCGEFAPGEVIVAPRK